jgi:hypothetical protein
MLSISSSYLTLSRSSLYVPGIYCSVRPNDKRVTATSPPLNPHRLHSSQKAHYPAINHADVLQIKNYVAALSSKLKSLLKSAVAGF